MIYSVLRLFLISDREMNLQRQMFQLWRICVPECSFFILQLAVSISRTAKQPRVPMTCWWMILKSTNLDMPQLSRKMELLERLWHFGQLDDKLSMR